MKRIEWKYQTTRAIAMIFSMLFNFGIVIMGALLSGQSFVWTGIAFLLVCKSLGETNEIAKSMSHHWTEE